MITGSYYDGQTSKNVHAHLKCEGEQCFVVSEGQTLASFPKNQIKLQDRIPSLARVIDFPDGSCMHSHDHDEIAKILGKTRFDFLHWLESNTRVVVGSIVTLIVFSLLCYFVFIPAVSKAIAPALTAKIGKPMTDYSISYIEKWNLIKKPTPSTELDERMANIRSIKAMAPLKKTEILLYDSKEIGGNAFTFPDNRIIMTTELLDILTDDEVTAVLLHEAGHAKYHHVMQSIIRNSLLLSFAMLLVGPDVNTLPMLILNSRYSRDMEREADEYAADELLKNDMPPEILGSALRKLTHQRKRKSKESHYDFLSTHPLTEDRVQFLKYKSAKKKHEYRKQ